MCVGDKRPVINSLREYVCIWAPIVKQTDIQIRMMNCTDLLNLSILTLPTDFRGPHSFTLSTCLILFELRVTGAHISMWKEGKYCTCRQSLTELSLSFY